jgi:hypothetical protein
LNTIARDDVLACTEVTLSENGEIEMMKSVCVLAILAAASTAAVAKDLKQDKKASAPTVAATQMTDAEMDKVTAGAGLLLTVDASGIERVVGGPENPRLENNGFYHSDGRGAHFAAPQ